MPFAFEKDDAFYGGTRLPSLSFKDLPIGSTFTCEVTEPAKLLQSSNFETGELDYWDAEKKNPKQAAVINVRVLSGPHSVGEERSIWAQRPSSLFEAIADAQRQVGARLAVGGLLHVRFDAEEKHQNPRFNPIKKYKAKYEPPVSQADPFEAPAAGASARQDGGSVPAPAPAAAPPPQGGFRF